MTYDVIYAPAERDNPEIFRDWAVWEGNLSLDEALEELRLVIREDFLSCADFAYRIIQHGKEVYKD